MQEADRGGEKMWGEKKFDNSHTSALLASTSHQCERKMNETESTVLCLQQVTAKEVRSINARSRCGGKCGGRKNRRHLVRQRRQL